jgi:hypothetical protein
MARLSFPLGSCHASVPPLLIAVVFAACVVAAGDAFGCPNCKDAVNTSDPDGLNVARGYFYSILIMLAMPCTLISSFGIYVWREMQRQKRAGLTADGQTIDGSPLVRHAGHDHRPSSDPITLPHS